ncbi:MAG TPA: hypothetical protein VJ572_03295 [Azonexus sp.]|nr:hypothetical protein [Azonexus sp.]
MKGLPRPQRGVALLLFLLVAFGFFSIVALSALNSSSGRAAQQRKTELALQQAKEALIGDAVANATRPGRLRCPEHLSVGSPIEGQAQTSCTTLATRIGRFPWNSLHLDRLTDSTGEPLWYAVSPGFSSPPINSNTLGQLQLDSTPNAAVAIIFAPGPPLPGQSRSPASPTNPPQAADYLDLGNAGGSAFVSTGLASNFNDQIAVITQSDLFNALNKRVLAELRGLDDQAPNLPIRGLRDFYKINGQFPWADSDADGYANANVSTNKLPFNELSLDDWLSTNNWLPLVTYTRVSANAAQLKLGISTLKVVPCLALPCP